MTEDAEDSEDADIRMGVARFAALSDPAQQIDRQNARAIRGRGLPPPEEAEAVGPVRPLQVKIWYYQNSLISQGALTDA